MTRRASNGIGAAVRINVSPRVSRRCSSNSRRDTSDPCDPLVFVARERREEVVPELLGGSHQPFLQTGLSALLLLRELLGSRTLSESRGRASGKRRIGRGAGRSGFEPLRRSFQWTGLVLVGTIVSGCGPRAPGEPTERPNFLVVSVDTLNHSALRTYSSTAAELPTLDAFAAQSFRFEAALSSASWTLPAHGSLLTGLYPDRHGATDHRVALSDDAARLPQALRSVGYETVAFTGGGYMGADYGHAQGFDRYNTFAMNGRLSELEVPRDGAWAVPGMHLFDRGIAYLRFRSPEDPPFFLFLHTYDVHDFYNVSPWAVTRSAAFEDLTGKEYLSCLQGRSRCPKEVFERLRQLYRAELEHLDGYFAALFEVLRETGAEENTVVVLLSDHGEGFDPEGPRLHHGGRLHADQLKIPLLFRMPGKRGRSIPNPVSIVDVAPTLADLAGASPLAAVDGQSLAPLLGLGGRWKDRPLLAMEHYFSWPEGRRTRSTNVRPKPLASVVVRDDLWYIEGPEGEQLYQMTKDPGQANNIVTEAPVETLAALRRILRDRSRDRTESRRVASDADVQKQLRALGYLE